MERMEKKEEDIQLTKREINLIGLIRSTEFGEIKIIIQDREPIRVEELKKSIKL